MNLLLKVSKSKRFWCLAKDYFNEKRVAVQSTIEDFELTNQFVKANVVQCVTEQLKEGIQADILRVLSESLSEFNELKMTCDYSQ